MSRLAKLREIERLDPERDCQRIMHLSFGYEFAWDSTRALEVALYRTYCVPSISRLLDRTGEFYAHTQRRYDDTALLVAEMCQWGFESGRGREALERMNWVHGHFKIDNNDYLYVLSTFIFEPLRWIDRFGWRRTCRNEQLGYYHFWRQVGTRMGIRDIPATFEAFEAWAAAYEKAQFRFAESNRRIGTATRDLFASWYPRVLAPLVHYGIYALLDDAMLAAFGFPRPLPFSRSMAAGALRLRGRLVRWLPARSTPNFVTGRGNRTWPRGYRIAELGPPRMIEAEQRSQSQSGTPADR